MTIKQRLFVSFSLIQVIIILIIGTYFYTTYNLNEAYQKQSNSYDQIRRVEKLKEYNHSFAWIVLDIVTDYEKKDIVKERLTKAQELFKKLYFEKSEIIKNSNSKIGQKKLLLIFDNFKKMQTLIEKDLFNIDKNKINPFDIFNKKFDNLNKKTDILLNEKVNLLQIELDKTDKSKDDFIQKIKLELFAFLFSHP